jgi:prophage DNA circulation protein
MSTIKKASQAEWRKKLRPASFKGAMFHVEQQARSSGRRIVPHEFPKRDTPWAEDMGRHAIRYQITGYVIQNDRGMASVGRDYLFLKDRLIRALESSDPGELIDPYVPTTMHLGYSLKFMCERYSVTETREQGGYATFEMMFVEAGQKSNANVKSDTSSQTGAAASDANDAAASDADKATKTLTTTPLPPRRPATLNGAVSGPIGAGLEGPAGGTAPT